MFHPDQLVISTLPAERSTWLRNDVVDKAREAYQDPRHARGVGPGRPGDQQPVRPSTSDRNHPDYNTPYCKTESITW